ncbi:MAG: TonB family protein [Paludibacteraceae bacterium]|nr:TonB family protein [Paludibacteraceae bacterium]
MTPKQERHIIASIGTVLFMGLVMLLLWLLKITVNKPMEQDYIEVTLAEDIEVPEPVIPKVKPDPAPSQEKDPGAASPAKSEPTNQPTQQSTEQIVSEEELLAIRQQHIKDSIAEANRQAKKKADDLIGGIAFGPVEEEGAAANKTQDGGKGTSYRGSGSDGENKWTLDGRGLVGRLPKPANSFNQEGTVVVKISVDKDGNVIDAEVSGGNISDKATTDLALEAAKRAKFTSATSIKQTGTITYKFKFN